MDATLPRVRISIFTHIFRLYIGFVLSSECMCCICAARAWYYYIQINHFHLGKLIFVYPQMRLPISKSILQWYSVLKGEEKPYKNNFIYTYTHAHHTLCHLLVGGSGGFADCVPCAVCSPASAYMHRIQDAWRPPGYYYILTWKVVPHPLIVFVDFYFFREKYTKGTWWPKKLSFGQVENYIHLRVSL